MGLPLFSSWTQVGQKYNQDNLLQFADKDKEIPLQFEMKISDLGLQRINDCFSRIKILVVAYRQCLPKILLSE